MIDVNKIASLARLKLSKEEERLFQEQFSAIMGYFQDLDEVDVRGVEPLRTPIDVEQHLRKDEAQSWAQRDLALESAPERSGDLFKVPPVV